MQVGHMVFRSFPPDRMVAPGTPPHAMPAAPEPGRSEDGMVIVRSAPTGATRQRLRSSCGWTDDAPAAPASQEKLAPRRDAQRTSRRRLKLPVIPWLAALVGGQAAAVGCNMPILAPLPDEPLRLARADGAADHVMA
jgi:hypothetical protein